MLMALIVVAMVSMSQNKTGTVVTGTTTLKYPINFTAADTIDASETYWVLVDCKQNYSQTQSVAVTMATVSGSPSVAVSLEGKTSSLDDYTEIVSASTWTSSANNPITLVTSTANKYRYFKIKFVASGATQKSKVTGLTFTSTYQNTTTILATTGQFTGNVLIGETTPNDTRPSLTIKGDADSDAGGDTSESLIAVLTPNATPTLATWGFTSTQSAGYTFDKNVTFNGGVTLGAGDDLIGSATSDITINTDKFTVAGATGNTAVGGTLGVTGAQSNSSTITVTKDGDNVVIDPSTDLHVIDIQVNSASKFNVDSTGVVTAVGAINSGGGVNLGTSQALTGTTAMTIGNNGQTVAINSSDWDIDATGIATNMGTYNGLTIANGIGRLVTTATASADTLSAGALLSAADQFVTVTSGGAAYKLMLPVTTASTVGMIIRGWVGANGFELRVAAADANTVKINDVTTLVEAAIPAETFFKVECISATQWILTATTKLGAVITAIIPDAL